MTADTMTDLLQNVAIIIIGISVIILSRNGGKANG